MEIQDSNSNINETDFERMVRLYEEGHALREKTPLTALDMAQKSLDLSLSLQNYEYQILSCHLKGICLRYLSRFDEALETMKKVLDLSKEHFPNDRQKLADAFGRIASVYYDTHNNQLAINYFLRSLSVVEGEPIRGTHINLGVLYGRIGDYAKAIQYVDIAIEIAEKKNDTYLTANHLYNKAYLYMKMEELEKAKQIIANFQKWSKTIPKKQENEVSSIKILCNGLLGAIYKKENNYQLSLEKTNEALKLAAEYSMHKVYFDILLDKANLHFMLEEEHEAMVCIEELIHEESKATIFQKQKTLKLTETYYEEKGEPDKAYPFLKQLYEISEEELKTAKGENLKKIIVEREEEINLLEEKNREIKEHNAILEQFAHIISHDLREPIRGINGFVNLLDKYYGKGLDERGKEYIDFILSETSIINNNLARLLEYTSFKKPEAGEIASTFLPEIMQQVQQKCNPSDVPLHVSCDDIQIKMTNHHARCLFGELIANATQFRKKDEDCKVEIRHSLKDNFQHISVKDFGIGIEPKYQEKVFKIFNRLNKQENKGAGVGLAICERIIGLYNGRIWIESVPNKYTIFYIEIAL